MENEVLFKAHQTNPKVYGFFAIGIIGTIFGLAMLIIGLAGNASSTTTIGIIALIIGVVFTAFAFLYKWIRSKNTIEFYKDYRVIKSGVLSKKEQKTHMTKVLSVSVNQTLDGRIFNYGNVKIEFVDGVVTLGSVKKPKELKAYIEELISKTNYDDLHQAVTK